MKMLLIFILIFSTRIHAQDVSELEHLLNLDRFHSYSQDWADVMKKRGHQFIAKTVLNWKVHELNIPKNQLTDVMKYDDLIFSKLAKENKKLKLVKSELRWEYNFYKRKLNLTYKLKTKGLTFDKPFDVEEKEPFTEKAIKNPPLKTEDVLLDVDAYASNRTTRGVFWEASKNKRRIELHIGSAGDFKQHLKQTGARVIGEVETMARNYNPIYLVQDKGTKDFYYAITEISGHDRLTHLSMQSSLIRWQEKTGKLAPPKLIVVGDTVAKLTNDEIKLTQILKVVPKADHVIIGQKGAVSNTFKSLSKAKSVIHLLEKKPNALNKILDKDHFKLITHARSQKIPFITSVMKNASNWEKIYDLSLPLLEKNKIPLANTGSVFSLDNNSYEVEDFLIKDKKNKIQRWRLFSNSWGDEILPIAKSLKNTGHTKIVYIGTAGAMPNSTLEVGDLVVPKKTLDFDDKIRIIRNDIIPLNAQQTGVVGQVESPFQETKGWLAKYKNKIQLVEVETGYLTRVFNSPNDKLTTLLLISDKVGSEGETLAEATSSARKTAQIEAISTVLNEAGVVSPVEVSNSSKIYSVIEEMIPDKDPLYKFRIHQEAMIMGFEDVKDPKLKIKKIIQGISSFSTEKANTQLILSDENFDKFEKLLNEKGIKPKLSLEVAFLEGRWSPENPIKIHLKVSTPKIKSQLQTLINKQKDLNKLFEITADVTAPNKEYLQLMHNPDEVNSFKTLYQESALYYGGLAPTETRTGSLKFVKVAHPIQGKMMSKFSINKNSTKSVRGISCDIKNKGCDCVLGAINTLLKK